MNEPATRMLDEERVDFFLGMYGRTRDLEDPTKLDPQHFLRKKK